MSEFKYTDEFFKEYEQRYMTPTTRTEKPQVPNKPKRKSKYKRLRLSI